MSTLAYIITFSLLGGVASLIGGLLLLLNEKFTFRISHFLSAFAAGTLIGAAFFDLLPEALESNPDGNIFLWVTIGIVLFFLLERFIHWFHHHHEHSKAEKQSIVPLVAIGDSIHDFIDGVAIAGTFMIDINLGIVTTIAIAAHEIPQEIGDFAILLHRGVKKIKVLAVNFISALAAVIGAMLTYLVGSQIEAFLPAILAVTAGFFIYIALSDLIPEIHHEEKRSTAALESLVLIVGILAIYIFVSIFEGH